MTIAYTTHILSRIDFSLPIFFSLTCNLLMPYIKAPTNLEQWTLTDFFLTIKSKQLCVWVQNSYRTTQAILPKRKHTDTAFFSLRHMHICLESLANKNETKKTILCYSWRSNKNALFDFRNFVCLLLSSLSFSRCCFCNLDRLYSIFIAADMLRLSLMPYFRLYGISPAVSIACNMSR